MKKIIIILLLLLSLLVAYIGILILFYKTSGIVKCNEFGDYVGGILNPLFTLLSTFAIIYLTYIIAINEDDKAEKSIETQKRITLNQMRQEALNRFSDKLNLFIHDIDKMTIAKPEYNKFIKAVLTKNIRTENKENTTVWLIILSELENFILLEFLFKELFENEEFKELYDALNEVTSKLVEDQSEKLLIEQYSLSRYIELKQKIIMKIGNYIYSKF